MTNAEIYWLNPATGNSTESVPDGSTPYGAASIGYINGTNHPELWWQGYVGIAAGEYVATLAAEIAYSIITGRQPMLRQRQSPRGNPTRLHQVPSLRQRQTFT
jgi:hypothetical protein